jgi:hypothetical protein
MKLIKYPNSHKVKLEYCMNYKTTDAARITLHKQESTSDLHQFKSVYQNNLTSCVAASTRMKCGKDTSVALQTWPWYSKKERKASMLLVRLIKIKNFGKDKVVRKWLSAEFRRVVW